jgi:hypothetical protein
MPMSNSHNLTQSLNLTGLSHNGNEMIPSATLRQRDSNLSNRSLLVHAHKPLMKNEIQSDDALDNDHVESANENVESNMHSENSEGKSIQQSPTMMKRELE